MNRKKKIFYLEITRLCNLTCPFCPSNSQKNRQIMTKEAFEQIIDKIKNDVSLLYFHVLGEPTLHPEFEYFSKYCDKLNLDFAITTNGTNLEVFHDEILQSKYLQKINISLQCLIEFNDKKRDDYLDALHCFLDRKNKINDCLPINLRLWNDKKQEKVVQLNEKIILEINKWKIEKNYKNVRFSYDEEFIWPNGEGKLVKSSNCLGGKRQLAILNDGSVVLCCLDYLGKTKIGNILEERLEDIYNKDVYQAAISGFYNQKPYFEICKKCSYRSRFN
jgi:radical SAM domain protein